MIVGPTGYATLDRRAAAHRHHGFRAWRKANPGVHPRKGPHLVCWRVLHNSCDTEATEWDFRISVDTMKTPTQLLYRTLAIAERPWFNDTDWRRLVRRLLKQLKQPGTQ
ncbi:hypothetical protein [Mycobacterium montefiorense]|nr:hypothetical protein [Mycobacterium montefiorense]